MGGEESLASTIKGKLSLLFLAKMLSCSTPIYFAETGKDSSLCWESEEVEGPGPPPSRCLFPGREWKTTPLLPHLPAPSPGCSLPAFGVQSSHSLQGHGAWGRGLGHGVFIHRKETQAALSSMEALGRDL